LGILATHIDSIDSIRSNIFEWCKWCDL